MRRLLPYVACGVLLSACQTTRQDSHPATPPPEPSRQAAVVEQPANEESSAAAEMPAVDDSGLVPPCLPPAESPKAVKPRPKPKRPVVKQEPPPQMVPVAEPPANALVDADLKLLNSTVESVLGKKVQGLKGEDFGRVVDVLADANGRVRVAIIDYGGFLGVGNRRIAVDWALLRPDPEHPDQPLTLRITREKLQSAPAYKESARPPTLMVP